MNACRTQRIVSAVNYVKKNTECHVDARSHFAVVCLSTCIHAHAHIHPSHYVQSCFVSLYIQRYALCMLACFVVGVHMLYLIWWVLWWAYFWALKSKSNVVINVFIENICFRLLRDDFIWWHEIVLHLKKK